MGVFGGDEVRARDGSTCRQGTHDIPVLDIGGSLMPSDTSSTMALPGMPVAPSTTNLGVYARVVIPLGTSSIARVDCTQLFSLEIERLTMELEKMKKNGSAAVTVD
jgi:hypothetical protein